MARVSEDSLMVVLARRVGFRKTIKVLAFVIGWGTVIEDLGADDITIEDYAAWWRVSERTAFREQALFREALPGEDSPTRLWFMVRAKIDAKDKAAPAVLGTLRVAI